mgnify:CR=1 FL=1
MRLKKLLCGPLSIAVITAALGSWTAAAQDRPIIYQPNPDSPIEARNPKAPAETAEFEFVIGDWNAEITWTPPTGDPVTYMAKWHNHWVVDGHVVMQEWRGPFLTGTELRAYDTQKKQWTGQNVYVNGVWRSTTAKFEDGKMKVFIESEDKRGPFLNRETYDEIKDNSFKMYSDRSYDEGKTWETGRYSMVVTRAKE